MGLYVHGKMRQNSTMYQECKWKYSTYVNNRKDKHDNHEPKQEKTENTWESFDDLTNGLQLRLWLTSRGRWCDATSRKDTGRVAWEGLVMNLAPI